MSERVTVYDESGKKLVLGPNDHLATGGEGAVYARGDTVFKVYLDADKARAARMGDKLALLKQLRHPGIAAPAGALHDSKGLFLGLTFPRVEGEALCRLFTNTWRDAHGFGPDQTRKVVAAMRDIVQAAHRQHAVMVDGNELNWLVAPNLKPTAIDVDSWQLPGFPGTAIMPSIRDPLVQTQFSEGSDWYAWAIVTFQLWTGIHPYKGTHPDFARAALAERMKARASVFDSRVRLPAAVRDFSEIPAGLKAWYEGVFNNDSRSAPPSPDASAVPVNAPKRLQVLQSTSRTLRIERLGALPGRIRAAFNGFVLHEEGAELRLWDTTTKQTLQGVSTAQLNKLLVRQAAVLRLPAGQPVWVELDTVASTLRSNTLTASSLW
jgi:DNA-binding helix-hairpin-helix protein with protein kinase domain